MAKDHQQLWEGVASETDEAKAVRVLAEILTDKKGRDFILDLECKEAISCIGILDYGIASCNLEPAERINFLVALRRLAENHELLPDRMRMTEKIVVSDQVPIIGGFGCVRSQMYGKRRVAVKTAMVPILDENMSTTQKERRSGEIRKIRKRFYREVVLWSTLSHPNVLKLDGVQEDVEKRQFVTVSEWMMRGTIMEYIDNEHVNRLELLHGAAQGLEYLHDARLAHGDLKGANILMSNETPPRACLADFGFITKVLDPGQASSCSAQIEGGTAKFMAPELLVPGHGVPNKGVLGKGVPGKGVPGKGGALPTMQADVYAFGLVIFQVLTGETPFSNILDSAMGHHVLLGMRPEKPEAASAIGISDNLWSFTERCWEHKKESRPKVGEIVTHLREATVDWGTGQTMPPRSQAKDDTSRSEEEMSDSASGVNFLSPLSGTGESSIGSRAVSTIFSLLSALSTQPTEPLQEEPQVAVTEPQKELQQVSQDPAQLRSEQD